jgi:hypothetical protein
MSINTKVRLDVHRLNEDDAAHKAALAKYLADGNKITQCVDTQSPKRRKTPVHCTGSSEQIPAVKGRYAQCVESGYIVRRAK